MRFATGSAGFLKSVGVEGVGEAEAGTEFD